MHMLRAIDGSARSIDRAAQSSDPSFAQASVDRATIDGSHCAIDGSLDCAARSKYRPLPKWNFHGYTKTYRATGLYRAVQGPRV